MTVRNSQITLSPGELIQWYRVERVLGRGGFGVTYLATDTNLDHKVAIKEYLPGSSVVRHADNSVLPASEQCAPDYNLGMQRFLREARTLVKFRHPNIVRVMTVFEANNTAYLIMEYEEGEQFKNFAKQNGGVSEEKLKTLLRSIIDGLDQVHQYGFIHRDIKPVNLIIRNDGSPVLIDFGSARPTGNGTERSHTSFVSVGYTPLEQYQEGAGLSVGPWTDIYSLGATLYYAVSGETPVSSTSRLAALVEKSPDPLRPATEAGRGCYSSDFLQAIDWALRFQTDERPQSLSQWRLALLGSSDSIAGEAQPAIDQAKVSLTSDKARLRYSKTRGRRQSKVVPGSGISGRFAMAKVTLLAMSAVLVATAGTLLYSKHREAQYFADLLERADAYREAGAIHAAAPLYQQVLRDSPGNLIVLGRIQSIGDGLENKVNGHFRLGQLQQAERSIRLLAPVDAKRAAKLDAQLSSLQQSRQREEKYIVEIERLLDAGHYDDALAELDQWRSGSQGSEQIDALANKVRATQSAAIDQATRREAERLEKERANIATKKRITEANVRQRIRRKEYGDYLAYAEQALIRQDTSNARRWLENARSRQINDGELLKIEARVIAAEAFHSEPLSKYEISYSTGQFNSLKRAVESKNLRAISELTEPSPSRRHLFENLFERYTRLKANVIEVEPHLDPKRVTAKLRIDELGLPNGDVVYPSPSYRDSVITLERNRGSWSKIKW